MRPFGSPKTLERRRRRAIALLEQGLSPSDVARRVGADPSSIWRWREAHSAGGEEALAPRPVPGRPPELRTAQQERLWKILLKGAVASGFPNEVWTLKRIASLILRKFGIRFHPGHVWKLLRGAGWSCQVPERRAIQRDEEAIAHWKRYKWPAIKKSPATWCSPRVSRRKRLPPHTDPPPDLGSQG